MNPAKLTLHASRMRQKSKPQGATPKSPGASESVTVAATAAPDAAGSIESGDRLTLIAQSAYYRAERRGFAPGHELEDWLAAERDLEPLLP